MKISILETISSVETQNGEVQDGLGQVVTWPCRTEELNRQIEAVLFAHPREDQPTY